MKSALVFIFFYLFSAFIIGGTTYLVFWKGAHGAWYLLTILFIILLAPTVKTDD